MQQNVHRTNREVIRRGLQDHAEHILNAGHHYDNDFKILHTAENTFLHVKFLSRHTIPSATFYRWPMAPFALLAAALVAAVVVVAAAVLALVVGHFASAAARMRYSLAQQSVCCCCTSSSTWSTNNGP